MNIKETKLVCDLISVAINAVATHTEEEAVQYLEDYFPENELVNHTITILNQYVKS